MSRPISVTASAVVAILGSLIALAFAAFLAASPFIAMAQPQPPNSGQFAVAGAAMFAAFGAFGIWTAVGLFRLRPWARTSILIFAGFLGACFSFSLLIIMLMPLPPQLSAGTGQTLRGIAALMLGIPVAIALWWLIQFNTQSTKDAFAAPFTESPSARPISITAIAWMSIVGGISCVYGILGRLPAFLFGAIINGWMATIVYVLYAVISLYIGKGLLDLRDRARLVAIAWFGFGFVHMSVVTFVPSLRQRIVELQRTMIPDQNTTMPFDQGILGNVSFALAALVAAAAIYFLIRNRTAFVRADSGTRDPVPGTRTTS
jgi:hypothetical protein